MKKPSSVPHEKQPEPPHAQTVRPEKNQKIDGKSRVFPPTCVLVERHVQQLAALRQCCAIHCGGGDRDVRGV
jgi:hypothetical protein